MTADAFINSILIKQTTVAEVVGHEKTTETKMVRGGLKTGPGMSGLDSEVVEVGFSGGGGGVTKMVATGEDSLVDRDRVQCEDGGTQSRNRFSGQRNVEIVAYETQQVSEPGLRGRILDGLAILDHSRHQALDQGELIPQFFNLRVKNLIASSMHRQDMQGVWANWRTR